MLKRRFKSLLCYMLILMLLVCNLVTGNAPNALALTPGTMTKELTLVPGKTLCLDTRYNYKIKKSNFIEYIKYYGDNNYLYQCDNDNDYVNSDFNDTISADTIDWNTITEYAIYAYDQPGYGFNYYPESSSVINATEDGEYLVFSFYSEYGAKIFIDYVTYSPKHAIYDIYDGNNRVVLGMYYCRQGDGLFSDFNATDDVDFRAVTDWKKGDVVKPNEVIIDYATQYVKVVANQIPSLDLTNTCTIKRGQAHHGVSGMGDTFYFQFDDTYPTYTYINSDYGEVMNEWGDTEWHELHTFGVDVPTDSVYYLDYFTGDLIYRDILVDGVTPTLYQHPTDDYAAWINSETGNAVTQSDLKGGLIVYGIPSELDVVIRDGVTSDSEDSKYKLTADSDLSTLSSIKYELLRTDTFNSIDYPLLCHLEDLSNDKVDLYKHMCLSAEELKPVYDFDVYAICADYEATLYDGKTGSAIDTTDDIMWVLTTVDGKKLSEIEGNMITDIILSDIKYTLSMSDVDKELYPHIFSASEPYCDKGIFEKYNNNKFTYLQLASSSSYISVLINAEATINNPTCIDKGEVIYSIAYDFCDEYGIRYLLNDTFEFSESNRHVNMDMITDSNLTSSLISVSNNGVTVGLVLGHIDNFDAFVNPYLLTTYGVKQYESLYLYAYSSEILFEFYPTYSNGELYYNVCYNNDFDPKYSSDSEWDYKLSFANDADGIKAYNEWLDEFPQLIDGSHNILCRSCSGGTNTKIVTANRNNPLDTSTSGIIKNTYNAVKFNLTGVDNESTSVTSVFFKNSDNDNIYLKSLNTIVEAPHSETQPIDELGHQWESEWVELDINNIDSWEDITDINSSVVDLDSLLANAENEIDASLLSDTNNKLRYRLCSRMSDAYELEIYHVHKYGTPVFDWAEDYSSCKVTFECLSNDDSQTLDCDITSNTVRPTCTVDGSTTYTATVEFNGQTYTDTKVVTIPADGHDYKNPVFEWSDDYSDCEAVFECVDGDDTQRVECDVTTNTIPPTCTVDGSTTYTATVEFKNETYTDTKVVTIPAEGHTYKDPVFEWSDEDSDDDGELDCEVIFECIEGDDSKTFDCDVTHTTVDAKCTVDGSTTYVATIVFKNKTYTDTHVVVEPKLGHQFSGNWITIDINDVNSYAAITAINNSVIDLDSLLANAENEIDKTLLNDSNNKLRYRICGRNNDAYELSINHIHKYGNPTFDWADDYSSCVAIFECTSDDDIQRVNCSISNSFVKPTCTEKGKTTYTATAIFQGMTYADNKFVEVDELGHEFGKWHVTKYPTYHEEGEESRSCIRNDKTETRPIPKYTKVAIVDGYLRDDNGNPIKNSKVEMHSDPMYTYTDENGYFKFEDVEIGDHTLKVFDASNNVICEFALNIDIEESDVNDNYVSDKFKWDSTINESNVNLRIDGVKVNPPFTGSPETGVDSHIQLYFILFVLSFGSLVALVVTCRRKKESCE